MPDQDVPSIADELKSVMDQRGVKLTFLASETGVPYRSLQNYFSRRTEMPATVYLKICKALGLDGAYVSAGRFDLDFEALQEALRVSLGALLPKTVFESNGALALASNGDAPRTQAELQRHAGALAVFVRGHYDLVRERNIERAFSDEAE